MLAPQRVIVDADVGSDDWLALLILFWAEALGSIVVEAIVCSMGNAPRNATCVNTMRFLETIQRTDVPVYEGSLDPYLPPNPPSDLFNGVDGFGDLHYDTSPNMALIQPVPASIGIGEMVLKHPGEFTLVCTAPVTNVAASIRLYDGFADAVKEIWIMGGSYDGFGNVKKYPTAEYNFYTDVEAAHVVLEAIQKIYLLTWEGSLNNQVSFDWRFDVFGKMKENNKAINLLNQAEKNIYEGMMDGGWGPPDALLAAAFVQRQIVTSESYYSNGTVELTGSLTRGQLVLTKAVEGVESKITIVNKLDIEKWKDLLLSL